MKALNILLLLFFGILLNSCEGLFPCLEGNGVLTEREPAVSSFSGVYNTTDFDVQLIYSTETKLVVQADENLHQYIDIYVENGDLIIETDNGRCLSSKNQILVTIYSPLIETISLSGSGDIDAYDFKPEYLNVTLSGSGNIELNRFSVGTILEVNVPGSGDVQLDGKSPEALYTLSGSGDIDGKLMKINQAKVILSGSGNIDVYAYETLEINLSGSGNIYVYGDPVIDKQRISGSGKVIHR